MTDVDEQLRGEASLEVFVFRKLQIHELHGIDKDDVRTALPPQPFAKLILAFAVEQYPAGTRLEQAGAVDSHLDRSRIALLDAVVGHAAEGGQILG